ncbi:DUF4126 domain-containing protein [Rhodoferax sediminis]|uniref:DUF4126 domain-containing protein n=1 Tax=Rhodoferax sediminis TaxID=2509614 RepID=A0A515D741_9BURK|nr:DUF4126 domain-containing protein [Rhodoferax sediminis]
MLQTLLQSLPWLAPLGSYAAGTATAGVGQAAGHLDMASLLALAAALGWASGLRLYAVVFMVGVAGLLGWIPLPDGLTLLQHPAMLAASGFMLFVEFFADKIPGVDSLWDIVHSVIRIPAGAALAAGVFGADGGTMTAVAALMGGTLAATSQAAKTTTRAVINTSPEPVSNVLASLTEDGVVVGALWLSIHYPLVFGVVLAIMVALMWAMTWLLLKFLKAVFRRVARFFSGFAKVT